MIKWALLAWKSKETSVAMAVHAQPHIMLHIKK